MSAIVPKLMQLTASSLFFTFAVRRARLASALRCVWLRWMEMQIGPQARVGRIHVLWPNQVSIGRRATICDGVVFDYCHGTWRPGPSIVIGERTFVGRHVEFNVRVSVRIGDDCLIASGCKLIDHDHGLATDRPMNVQDGAEAAIEIEDDVWLGANVIVTKGVRIGRGAIVGAGAVVTRSIPPLEIWAGVPARRIGSR